MKLPTGTPRALIAATALCLASVGALAQPTITEMPPLSGPTTWSWALGISADGHIVVGTSSYPGTVTNDGAYSLVTNGKATRWNGTVPQNLSGTNFGIAYSANQDGSAVTGMSGDGAFRWSTSSGFLLLPRTTGQGLMQWARGISRDGTTIGGVGTGSAAYRWTAATGTQLLSAPSPVYGGKFSSNGQVLVGWSGTTGEAYRFVGSGAAQVIASNARALGVSFDGRIILGVSYNGVAQAVRWDYPSIDSTLPPTPTTLGVIAGSHQELCEAYGSAISDDGLTIVGTGNRYVEGASWTDYPWSAFIWRPELGLVDLNLYLPSIGLDLGDWHLRRAEDISADGRVVVGQGIRNGLSRGFVLRLPPWCSTADFNNDGDFGTDADIEAFFACLAGNCCPTCWHLGSDFNADGDAGTDADIEAFFRVLAGQAC